MSLRIALVLGAWYPHKAEALLRAAWACQMEPTIFLEANAWPEFRQHANAGVSHCRINEPGGTAWFLGCEVKRLGDTRCIRFPG